MSLTYGLNVKKKSQAPARRTLLDDDDADSEEDAPQQSGSLVEEICTLGSSGSELAPPRPSRTAPAFGLTKPKSKAPPKRKDGAGDNDDDGLRQDLSALRAAEAQVKVAENVDSSIFDYDSFHDAKTSVSEAKKAARKQDAIERKPKYINNLLDAAARRKQDQQIAREKFLQKEREAEGDEFAGKDKFVTGAYKAQQEETRRLEEEEKKKQEEEERQKRETGGGMQGFYRTMMDQSERQHQEAIEAAEKAEKEGVRKDQDGETKAKSDAEIAAEMRAKGVNVHVNEEGQITDKRELLTAGLNVAPSGKGTSGRGADHLKTANRSNQSAFPSRNKDAQQATRERQSRLIEEQLAERAKRQREEDEAERAKQERAAKSAKTETDISDAKARYLARKAAREQGKG